MTQERVMAQVQTRLLLCLEQRDRPGILALTTWLVHRHGHSLLQQLLSQPEWESHRLWWGRQISRSNPDLQPQPQPSPKTIPTARDHQDKKTSHKTRTPMAAQVTPDPWEEPAPPTREHPEPGDGLRLDEHSAQPANPTPSSDPNADAIKLTPAQVTKQRLKMDKSAKFPKHVPIQEQERTAPTVTPATPKEQQQKRPPNQRHRSLHLRSWLPCSRLPHQDPQQDAA